MSMSKFGPPTRSRLPRTASAWAGGEAGDTMIEVMVASLVVALIAAAVFVGFGTVAHIAGAQRHQAQANQLAQQDEQRLRGLSVSQLEGATSATGVTGAALYGNATYSPAAIDGETFTVASTAQYVAASTGVSSCTSSSTSNADYIETASKVTWSNGTNDGRPAVIEHDVISPHVGGGLVIQLKTNASNPLQGVTVDVASADSGTQALSTDVNGCVVFSGLPGGTYTLSWPGYTSQSGTTGATVIVVNGSTASDTYTLAQTGAINATFTTSYTGATGVVGTADTFVASNSQLASPLVFGTPNTYSSTGITSPETVFPFTGTNSTYAVYAGACASDAPPSPVMTTVTSAATSNVSVPEPAMIVGVFGNTTTTTDDPASSSVVYNGRWTHDTNDTGNYLNTQSYSSTTNNSVTFTFTGTSVTWLTSLATNHGYANVVLSSGSTTLQSVQEDTYGNTHQYAAYSSATLPYGTYTLKISVAGSKDSNSSGTSVAIDAFIIGGPVTLLTTKPNVTVTDTGCAGNETYPPEQIPTATHGALVNPAEPYGNFTVCADNGTVSNTANVANTQFSAPGNPVNVYLNSGATGLTGGTCT
jgi:type II secretory pathway pseudopilin PulG